ncbi:hypothetical protein [Sphingomonas sp. RS2018]
MRLSYAAAFGGAWRLWRRDAGALVPIAGLTMFLPQYAVLLLVPPMPAMLAVSDQPATEAEIRAWTEALSGWLTSYGVWYALAALLGLFGALAVIAFQSDPARPTLGHALRRAVLLLPRYLLCSTLVAVPAVGILMPGAGARVLLMALIPVAFYLLGRTMLAGPVIVAQAPVGAVAAIQRSWRMTRGNGWVMAGSYGAVLLAAQLAGALFLALAALANGAGGTNPVVAAVFDGAASLTTAVAALALALVEVALYRRLSSDGLSSSGT